MERSVQILSQLQYLQARSGVKVKVSTKLMPTVMVGYFQIRRTISLIAIIFVIHFTKSLSQNGSCKELKEES